MNTRSTFAFGLALLALTGASSAFSHEGHAHDGLAAGLAHPLSGLDHLLALVGVGLWAAQLGKNKTWLVPLAFAGTMLLGGALGFMGVALPSVEAGIGASVLLLGLLIAFAIRLPLMVSMALVSLFALFHGHAHGAEYSSSGNIWLYGLGLALTTLLLHASGIGFFHVVTRKAEPSRLVRFSGAAIALVGAGLLTNLL